MKNKIVLLLFLGTCFFSCSIDNKEIDIDVLIADPLYQQYFDIKLKNTALVAKGSLDWNEIRIKMEKHRNMDECSEEYFNLFSDSKDSENYFRLSCERTNAHSKLIAKFPSYASQDKDTYKAITKKYRKDYLDNKTMSELINYPNIRK